MVKILPVVIMIVMGQAEEDLLNFMRMSEKQFEELQSKIQDLSEENAQLKIMLSRGLQNSELQHYELKKDIQKLNGLE